MTRMEALAWQVGCSFGAVLGVALVELYGDHVMLAAVRVRAAWRVWQAG